MADLKKTKVESRDAVEKKPTFKDLGFASNADMLYYQIAMAKAKKRGKR